jgi:hypothetical protein
MFLPPLGQISKKWVPIDSDLIRMRFGVDKEYKRGNCVSRGFERKTAYGNSLHFKFQIEGLRLKYSIPTEKPQKQNFRKRSWLQNFPSS